MLASILDRRLNDTQLLKAASAASLAVSCFLVMIKLGAYLATGSVSLLSSLLDSASDIVASLGTFFAVRMALVPADREHRYGHGKAESIAALGTAAFVTGSALFLVFEAISRLITAELPVASYVGVYVMLLSVLVTGGLVWFQHYAVRRTQSQALAADSLHYKADFLVNGAVILALFLTAHTGLGLIDVLFGLAIAAYLVQAVVPVAREAVDNLMDRELPEAERARIKAVARGHAAVRNVHDLRTRTAGKDIFIELHLELDPAMTITAAHKVGEEVDVALRALLPTADVLVHFDPAGYRERRRDDLIAAQSTASTDSAPTPSVPATPDAGR